MAKLIGTDEFLPVLKQANSTNATNYCFIIGSGCSVANGIPTGWALASKWYQELNTIYSPTEIESWKAEQQIDEADLGYYYSKIFKFRFAKFPGSGYAAINFEIEKGRTGFGHMILAQLLVKTHHNIIITTNFDTLIEETIYRFTEARPLICGHESVARYAAASVERPLILKIHRDRFMEPFNLDDEIAVLQPEWSAILTRIFLGYTPIVIGYGGNDGSLMNYLRGARPCQTMYWCTTTERPLRNDIMEVVDHHNGVIVRIESFNRLMLRLMEVYKIVPIDQLLHQKVTTQSNEFIRALLTLTGEVQASGSAQEKLDVQAISQTFDGTDWWKWEMNVQGASTIQQKIDFYQEALRHLPDSPELTYNFGHLLDDLQWYEKALFYLQKAVTLKPNFFEAWFNMGIVYRKLNNYDQAIRCYQKALELKPGNYQAWERLASSYHSIGEYTNAIEAYQKALSLNATKASVWNNVGFSYKAIGRVDEAIQAFEKALALKPNLPMPYFNLGNLFVDTDKEQAVRYYQQAVALDPDMADAYYNMGLVYDGLNQPKEAKDSFEKAYRINPNDASFKAAFDAISR